MEKKIVTIIEIFAIFIGLILYSIFVVVPEYKEKLGSSDNFINANHYRNMIEVRVDDTTDFAFLINEKGEVYHLFFFDNSSIFLYNKNIENHNLEDSLARSVRILIQNRCLMKDSKVEVIHYEEEFYKEFISSWEELSEKYSIPKDILLEEKDISSRALELGIVEESFSSILLNMDFYSKEFAKNFQDVAKEFSLEEAISCSNHVYGVLSDYVLNHNISQLEKGKGELVISSIAGDESLKYYPTSNSWYRVEDQKVYAYIEFLENGEKFSSCYRGSILERTEGEC